MVIVLLGNDYISGSECQLASNESVLCLTDREVHGRWVSMHAELGVECLQVLLVQLKHILDVEYLHYAQHTP